MGKITAQVMHEEFAPPRSGRRPMVDIESMQNEIRAASGKWVQFYFAESREANSALRQFGKMSGYEIASESLAKGGKNVFARWVPGKID